MLYISEWSLSYGPIILLAYAFAIFLDYTFASCLASARCINGYAITSALGLPNKVGSSKNLCNRDCSRYSKDNHDAVECIISPCVSHRLKFETSNSELFTPQFGNYKVWYNDSYVRYTDILPVTFAPSESKLLIFEIDNTNEREFSTVKVSTVKKTYTLRVVSQSNISIDRLVTIR